MSIIIFGSKQIRLADNVDNPTQAEVDTLYAKNAILTVDEIREELGKKTFKDIPEASKPGCMTPNNGLIPLSGAEVQPLLAERQKTNVESSKQSEESETPRGKAEKAAKISPERLSHASIHSEERIGSAVGGALKRRRSKTLGAIREAKSQ